MAVTFVPTKKYRRVVQLELNEISRPILDRLIAEGALPQFAALDRDLAALETTSEDKYEHLEPWIQWTTVHTGKSFAEHGVFRLGDARERRHDQTWERLSDAGVESAILGSMNAHRGRARGGLFFPDPWAKENDAYPERLRALWALVSRQVQGHAVAAPTARDVLNGLAACLGFRISLGLQAQIAAQLVRQRLDRKSGWRMAGLFDLFLFEAFTHVLRTTRYGFYSLFLNANAHYQHHFWRQFDKSGFDGSVSCPDCHEQDDPIRFGYRVYDRILGTIRALCRDPDTLLVVLSGLGQIPHRDDDAQGGMNYWRLRDHRGFATEIGLRCREVFPLMSRDWQVGFRDAQELAAGRALLESLRVGGEPLFAISQNQPLSLFLETKVTRAVAAHEPILGAGGRAAAPFGERFARIAVKSGKHTATGLLWTSERSAARGARQVPLAAMQGFTLGALLGTSAAQRDAASI